MKADSRMLKKSCVGLRCGIVNDISQTITQTRDAGFNYVCTNIVYFNIVLNNLKSDIHGLNTLNEPFSWSDMGISSSEWRAGVVGILPNLEVYLESNDKVLIRKAEDAIAQQMNYSHHLGIPAILIELSRADSPHLARILYAKLTSEISTSAIWLKVPMGASKSLNETGIKTEGTVNSNPWLCWHNMRTLCNNERKLYPVLELQANVPDEKEVTRWLGEPVKAIFICKDIFTPNRKGYPILSQSHQSIIRKFVGIGSQIVISASSFSEDLKYYKQYIDYLWSNMRDDEEESGKENTFGYFSEGYEDYLQSPLQPLMDNLESHIYEIFEKDSVKYDLYETAIYKALITKINEEDKDSQPLVVMIVGAGRGPLVHICLNASVKSGRKIRIYAIEKNVNAVNTLLHLKKHSWAKDDVTIVWSDMRVWVAPEKADLIISELLGSFGDNELSPECLDGAQTFLKADGIMIPQSYTSFIAPIMSAKLYGEVRGRSNACKPPNANFETPYVVHMHNKYLIDKPQALFVFQHPNIDEVKDNDRYGSRTFHVEQDCALHGFAGYFECCLFDDVLMSTHPTTYSPGMFSWFPIYFPIREPVLLKKSDTLTTEFWRKSSKSHVWYEWCISKPIALPVHNSTGKSYNIGLAS